MPIGRPRTFNIDEALNAALLVFWRKGYEGATLPDLTRAMGINRPSLYAAFGNKEKLFQKVIDRYAAGPGSYVREALAQATARAVVERLLGGTVELLADPRNPRGCLMVHGALACGEESETIRRQLSACRKAAETALRRRLERAKAENDLPPDANPVDLARFITTVMQGMAVQAAGGADRNALRRVARLALRAWPA
jgi:AcrR family transcriptional regulator